jgi:hypothetical protein
MGICKTLAPTAPWMALASTWPMVMVADPLLRLNKGDTDYDITKIPVYRAGKTGASTSAVRSGVKALTVDRLPSVMRRTTSPTPQKRYQMQMPRCIMHPLEPAYPFPERHRFAQGQYAPGGEGHPDPEVRGAAEKQVPEAYHWAIPIQEWRGSISPS